MLDKKSYWVYILKCSDDSLYTGITDDIVKRIEKHNLGEGAKYTRNRRPLRLVYSKLFESKSLAAKEEFRIKQLTRKQKLELIAQFK